MQPQADNPTPKAAPWAMIAADDQEKLCRELGAGRLAVWYRLSLYAVKAQSPRFAVSRRMLAFDCGLTREAVRQHLSDLERAGFIGVERSQAESHGDVANQYTIMRGPYAPPWPENGPPVAKKDEAHRGQKMATFPISVFQDLQDIETPRPSTGSAPQGQRQQEPRKQFVKPSLEEVGGYCTERRNGIDPQHFLDHYTANGWKVGKSPMKDWQAAVRTWERNGQDRHRTATTIKASAEDYSNIKSEVV
jgi:biotin operon repressor